MTYRISKKKIQLGTISILYSNWLPYASGCLISHCMRNPDIREKYTFNQPIYKHIPVEEYHSVLKDVDILGLTCYVWNQSYNDLLAQYYKSIRPDGIVIFGGPEIPEDTDAKLDYDQERIWLDTSIAGLGENSFEEWLLGQEISGTSTKQMPTPYTDGIFDNLLSSDEKFKVSFETNRGCPYGCAFCDWGGQAKSKLTRFDMSEIRRTIGYIYKYHNIDELEILDANFGILERDIEIVDYMIEQQYKNDNRLRISYSGLAKNGSRHLPIILKKIFDEIPIDQRNLKISFQTHSPNALKIIDRDNINNNRLIPLINEYKRQNITTTSEMIIALPGETADSWLDTLHHNYHTLGIDYIRTYILHIVNNTKMNSAEYCEKYDIKTKRISLNGQQVKIIHRCFSYDIDELIKMFDYHWFYHNLVNTDLIKPQIKNIRQDCLNFFDHLDQMPIIKGLIERQRDLIRKVFSDEPLTELNNSLEYAWFSSTLRQDDIRIMCQNGKHIEDELKLVFPQELNTNWICENPIRAVVSIT